ncbi:MAG: extracellular solute-binding protein, partial [Candidatus Hydrogenedentota bacterium]
MISTKSITKTCIVPKLKAIFGSVVHTRRLRVLNSIVLTILLLSAFTKLVPTQKLMAVKTFTTPVTIEIGDTSLPPHMISWLKDQIAEFESRYPNITVKTGDLGGRLGTSIRPYDEQIRNIDQLAGNVIAVQGGYDDELGYLTSNDLIIPVDNFIANSSVDVNAYPDTFWEGIRSDGSTWGVPFRADAIWLFCDWPLFQEAGLNKLPETWDEVIEFARILTIDSDGDGIPEQPGLCIPPSKGYRTILLKTLNIQDGVSYLQDGVLSFDQPQIRANFELIRNISHSGLTYEETITKIDFTGKNGVRPAMMLMNNNIPITSTYTEFAQNCLSNPNYLIAPIPDTELGYSPGISLYLAVRPGTPEEEYASFRLIEWLTRKDVPLPDFWFGAPYRVDLPEQPGFEKWSQKFGPNHGVFIDIAARSRQADVQFSGMTYRRTMPVME